MNCTLEKAAKLLLERKNFIFLCHARPDGDTVGSAYALKYALEAVGKTAQVLCADAIPARLEFLTALDGEGEKNAESLGDKPFVCAIDVAELHLLGHNAERYGAAIGLKVDHHHVGSEYGKYNYIDGKAAACGEIIYKLIRRLEEMRGAKMTSAACTALYAAIASDTGCFKYSNVTSTTLRIAAELIDGGADNYDVCHRLFELKSRAELKARQFMLNNTEYYADGRVAFLVITGEFRRVSGANDDDIGGVVSEMRETEGVELAITLKQDVDAPEKFKISMRSGLNISSSELCKIFGGGGHERAAGASVEAATPELAKSAVLERVLKAI